MFYRVILPCGTRVMYVLESDVTLKIPRVTSVLQIDDTFRIPRVMFVLQNDSSLRTLRLTNVLKSSDASRIPRECATEECYLGHTSTGGCSKER